MTRQRDSANAVISMEHVDLMMSDMLLPKDKAVNADLSYIKLFTYKLVSNYIQVIVKKE